jgi:allantoate deiminase
MRSLDPATTARLHDRLAELGTITDEPGHLTRWFFSPAMTRVHQRFLAWAAAAGLTAHIDAADNLRLRWISNSAPSDRPLLVIGSHLDTVRNAGRYDGPLGVLTGLACVEQLQAWGETLPFDLEVVGFSDEEGLRFQSAYLGSSFYAGLFPESWLPLTDAAGHTVGEVLASRGTPAPEILATQKPPTGLMGYLELHLEQGPILEKDHSAVGIVSTIAAQARARFTFTGRAGHAGTTPMELRQDALCAAAEAILTIESTARDTPGLCATVGQLTVHPDASNVIPAQAVLSLDIRHPDDAALGEAITALTAALTTQAAQRRVEVEWEILQKGAAVPMDPVLSDSLKASALLRQGHATILVSGAGHDAAVMNRICPTAMLFVRCRDGLSHHPDEYVAPADAEMGLAVLADTLVRLAQAPPS